MRSRSGVFLFGDIAVAPLAPLPGIRIIQLALGTHKPERHPSLPAPASPAGANYFGKPRCGYIRRSSGPAPCQAKRSSAPTSRRFDYSCIQF